MVCTRRHRSLATTKPECRSATGCSSRARASFARFVEFEDRYLTETESRSQQNERFVRFYRLRRSRAALRKSSRQRPGSLRQSRRRFGEKDKCPTSSAGIALAWSTHPNSLLARPSFSTASRWSATTGQRLDRRRVDENHPLERRRSADLCERGAVKCYDYRRELRLAIGRVARSLPPFG